MFNAAWPWPQVCSCKTEKQKNRKTEKAEKNIIESRKNSVPARTDVYAVLFYTLISGPENEKVCSQIMP